MLLSIAASAYTPHFVHFVAPVKNNVIENSLFSRIVYSTDHYSMNGLYIKRHSLAQIQAIETHSILKISGVWESETGYGLAYKFIHM